MSNHQPAAIPRGQRPPRGPGLLVGEADPNEEAVQFFRAPVNTTNGVVGSQVSIRKRSHGLDPPSKAVHLAIPPFALGGGAATAFLVGIDSALRRIRSVKPILGHNFFQT